MEKIIINHLQHGGGSLTSLSPNSFTRTCCNQKNGGEVFRFGILKSSEGKFSEGICNHVCFGVIHCMIPQDNPEPQKICKRCRRSFPFSFFYNRRKNRLGKMSECKACRKLAYWRYTLDPANAKKVQDRATKWNKENKVRRAEICRRYYEKRKAARLAKETK